MSGWIHLWSKWQSIVMAYHTVWNLNFHFIKIYHRWVNSHTLIFTKGQMKKAIRHCSTWVTMSTFFLGISKSCAQRQEVWKVYEKWETERDKQTDRERGREGQDILSLWLLTDTDLDFWMSCYSLSGQCGRSSASTALLIEFFYKKSYVFWINVTSVNLMKSIFHLWGTFLFQCICYFDVCFVFLHSGWRNIHGNILYIGYCFGNICAWFGCVVTRTQWSVSYCCSACKGLMVWKCA